MSLRGRYVIDRLKNYVGKYVKLPVPPYHEIQYWEGVYQNASASDNFEWGDLTLSKHLLQYDYKMLDRYGREQDSARIISTTTFAETINVSPAAVSYDDESSKTTQSQPPPIMLLGCGTSNLGQDMFEWGWKNIVSVDIVAHVLECMQQKSTTSSIKFVQDDATQLTAFQNDSVHAIIDKGLIDALYCVNQYEQLYAVMSSAQRVLTHGGIFIVFSFSRPEFLLQHLVLTDNTMWKDVQIRELNSIILYRFQKSDEATNKRKNRRRGGSTSRQQQ